MRRVLMFLPLLPLAVLAGCDPVVYYPPSTQYEATATYGTPAVTVEGQPNVSGEVVVGGGYDDEYVDTDASALTEFRATLDPYGTWVDDPTWGVVWVPYESTVGRDFEPYTAGHWVYDNDDYVWVSDYSWGWAPFHYGRWVYIGGRGWAWIPGRQYAGAWVDWRVGDEGYGYVGWAPMPPTWYWHGGVAVAVGAVPQPRWVYLSRKDLFERHLHHRVIAGPRVGPIAEHTRPWKPASPGVGHGGHHRPGPPPTRLGFQPKAVPHVTPSDTGIARARQLQHRPPPAQRGPAGHPGGVTPAPRGGGGGTPQPRERYNPPTPAPQHRTPTPAPRERYNPPTPAPQHRTPTPAPRERYNPPTPAPQHRTPTPAPTQHVRPPPSPPPQQHRAPPAPTERIHPAPPPAPRPSPRHFTPAPAPSPSNSSHNKPPPKKPPPARGRAPR